MSESETSSDIKVKYENSNGENLLEDRNSARKVQSSDTDYYFNIIANPNKITQKKITESESSDFNNIINDNNSESSSSKSKNRSSEKSNRNKSESSKSSTSSKSKEKYEKIPLFNQPPTYQPQSPTYQPQSPTYQTQPPTYQPQPPTYQPQPPTYQPQINSNKPLFIPIPSHQTQAKELSHGEIRMKKIEMLRKLSEIKSKGYQLSKEYDFNSSLDEMEYEYDLLKSFADKRNGVKVFKSGLLQVVSLVEFLNDKYDPFDFHLSGWGDHMHVETESWDDVLEEIYEKYKGTGKKVAPEIRLLLLMVASASAFHFTKSQSANLPGLDSLLSANPGLLSKIINPSKSNNSQFMTPQEINIEKQRAEIKKNQAQTQANNKPKIVPNISIPQQTPVNQSPKINNTQSYSAFGNSTPNTDQPMIRTPDQVKEILNRIHNIQPNNIKQTNTETQDETSSNNDRIVSETTLSDTNPNKKKYVKKPKKSVISII
jgi:hypothetical protein